MRLFAALPSFKTVGHKILAVVGSVVLVGLLSLVIFYADRQEKSILAQNERTLLKVTESVAQGLSAVMMQGYADIGEMFGERLKKVGDIVDFRILRRDGVEAFHDNQTIDKVNGHLGRAVFQPRQEKPATQVLQPDNPWLARLNRESLSAIYYEMGPDGHRQVTLLAPIPHAPECHKCHDEEASVRGILKLTTSLSKIEEDISRTWRRSAILLSVSLAVIFLVIYLVVRRAIVRPIHMITDALSAASQGDLDREVTIGGQDEINAMATSFNQMTRELKQMYLGLTNEQNKLTTIILSARDGIIATDGEGKIVLVNPAASQLLGKSADEIIAQGFLRILDDEPWIQQRIDNSQEVRGPEIFAYRDSMFSVQISTIRDDQGVLVGSSALIRDITAEKRLQDELKRLSVTDALTGLYNRRHFDAKNEDEFRRFKRYGRPFSIFLFDVDHFKKFNDTYGHEMGDKVLQTMGAVLRSTVREIDIPCRYGGEEFVVVMPTTESEAALALAETVRKVIEATLVDGLKVTVSIGVASCPPLNPDTVESVLKSADTALYACKEGGRNQVRLAQS
jgi:diguanylate cyclase (GGDEF)-like protein/PAS domain S-box-containing protein